MAFNEYYGVTGTHRRSVFTYASEGGSSQPLHLSISNKNKAERVCLERNDSYHERFITRKLLAVQCINFRFLPSPTKEPVLYETTSEMIPDN